MVTETQKRILFESMAELLELPESAYEKAIERYNDLGEWIGREGSICSHHKPLVFPQGSFRLGTAIRPLDEKEEYDLDLACKLQVGITTQSHSQQALKKLVGTEIESYRVARGIKAEVEEKHRCWRLEYADNISFHLDVVPCIPAVESKRKLFKELMERAGENRDFSAILSNTAVFITDDRRPDFKTISDDWFTSNPEGYAQWFESRMQQGQQILMAKAEVQTVPLYKRKTVLQRAVQMLKRHRDNMFKADPDLKPISMIITTLAARAYQGEASIETAITNILAKMGDYVNSKTPRVPNPVNPSEDFADRWAMQAYKHLRLEENFWKWLAQARNDFELVGSADDTNFVAEQAKLKFSIRLDPGTLRKSLGLTAGYATVVPKTHTIESTPPKPWGK